MATSLISTGVQFADSTIQTTAAVAGGGSAEIVASGSLSNGSKVVINTDGTVSAVAATAQSVGTPVVFESARADYVKSCFDINSGKVVVAYKDDGNSGYGTAVIGTISGTSISFGTPVVFESSNIQDTLAIAYDSTANKVVVASRNGGGTTTAKVGTVSGTSISFGSAGQIVASALTHISMVHDPVRNRMIVAYNSAGDATGSGQTRVGTVSGTSISFSGADTFDTNSPVSISTVFDSANQKVVISYCRNAGPVEGASIVATPTTSSVSFGTAVVFESGFAGAVTSSYDSTSGKVVVAYSDNNNSNYGTAIVGTVSGTSISFGTAVVFESASTNYNSASYNSIDNKTNIAYRDQGNLNYGTVIVGTVSGTSISFNTAVVFESAATLYVSTAYSPTNNKTAISYNDVGNSFFGTSAVFANVSTNLTSENYIGISSGVYTNGQTATIQLTGAVDDAQTSLTAGQSYFVQPDGTLGLTPGNPSVFAGTAVSSTKLIIKG